MINSVHIISLELRYFVLPKVTYLKFKPKFSDFYNIEKIKIALEQNLAYHTSITLHDLITIKYRGQNYPLAVTEVKPQVRYGSLINTDVEVDFEYSEQYDQHLSQQQQVTSTMSQTANQPAVNSASGATSASAMSGQGHRLGGSKGDKMEVVERENGNNDAADVSESELLKQLATILASTSAASTTSSPGAVLTAKFKLPNGKTIIGKFSHSSTLAEIVQFLLPEVNAYLTASSAANTPILENRRLLGLQLRVTAPRPAVYELYKLDLLQQTLEQLQLNVKTQLFLVELA